MQPFQKKTTQVTYCIVIISLAAVTTIAANSTSHEMTEHMQAMHALKDKVPVQYQIMNRTPVIPTEVSLTRGRAIFTQNCVICHGKGGGGDGVAAAAMTPPPANFLDINHSNIYGPGEKFWIISNGSTDTGMPEFSSQIERVDRWHLVNFILFLQQEVSN